VASIRKRAWITAGGEARESWIVDFRDQHGKRRHKQFNRKRDADAWLVQARGQVERGTFAPDSTSMTVAQAAQLWLERCEQDGLEKSTMVSYRSHVRYHIGPLLGAERLSRLTAPRIEQFRDELLAGNRSRPLARKVLTSLKAILKESQRRGLVAQNVAAGVQVRLARRHEHKVAVPTPDEIRELLATRVHGRWRPLLITAVFTGLRASELRGLVWEHVDFEQRVLHVRQRADISGRIGSLKSETSRRDVPMAPIAVAALKEWKLACPPGSLVFPGRGGRVVSHETLRSALGRLHRYRHFFASWLIDQGFGPKRVQVLMGHSSIKITFDVYGHLFPQEDDHDRFAAGELALVG
jgi:integrase